MFINSKRKKNVSERERETSCGDSNNEISRPSRIFFLSYNTDAREIFYFSRVSLLMRSLSFSFTKNKKKCR